MHGIEETVAVRDLVLAGRTDFVAWTGFLLVPDESALALWFGSDRLCDDPESVRYAIDRDILVIDRLIASQLDAILHHARFQALEGRWRGLAWLHAQVADDLKDRIALRLLNATWQEIERDMVRTQEFDQSHLFRLVYEGQFGQAGGDPFGLLLADRAVRHKPARIEPDDNQADKADLVDDRAVLQHLAQIAAAAFAPIVVGASPDLLGADQFGDLAGAARPAAAMNDPDHYRWRELRDRPDSRFLAVALPRVLARPPWPDDGTRGDGFRYRESAASVRHRTWMSAAYPFAAVVARAAARFGWPADVRGANSHETATAVRPGGGLVPPLPADPHWLSPTLSLPRLPVEVVFTDQQERDLIEAGLMPLGALPYGDTPLFGAVRSLHRPPVGARPGDFADSRVATQMNALLCACRFAHFLKIRGRQTIGRLRQPQEIEFELTQWLNTYVNRNTMSTPATRAARPLFAASVQVSEQADKPGAFDCTINLQPYHQLDNVAASFKFETEIAPPAA